MSREPGQGSASLLRLAAFRLRRFFRVRPYERWGPYAIIGAISFAIAVLNVQGNYALHFIDIAWPPNPDGNIQASFFAWSHQNLGGVYVLQITLIPEYVWVGALSGIGLPVGIQEILTIGLFQTIAGAYAFRLFREFILPANLSKLTLPIALTAAIISVANYAVQITVWWDGILAGFIFMAGTIAMLYYVSRLWKEFLVAHTFDFTAFLLALLAGVFSFNVGVPFVASSLILLFTIPPFILFRLEQTSIPWAKIAVLEAVSVGLSAAASLWWLFASYLESALVPSALGGTTSTTFSLGVLNQTAGMSSLVIFRGLYGAYYPATMFTGGAYTPGNVLIYESVGYVASWLIIALFALALLCSHRGKGPLLYSLSVLIILGLLFLGESSPAYSLFISPFLSNSLFLLLIRNPMVTFGYAFTLFSIIASTLAAGQLIRHVTAPSKVQGPPVVSRRRPRRLLGDPHARAVALVVIIVVAMVLPYVAATTPIYSGDAIPQSPYQARAQIPSYEYQVASYLDSHLGNSNALLFPGGFLEQNWTHGYDAYDILPELLPQARLIYQVTNQYSGLNNGLVSEIYTLLSSGETQNFQFASLLNRMNILFVVIEGEVGGGFPFGATTPPNYPLVLESLNRTEGISLSAVIGPDYLYSTTSLQLGEVRPVTDPVNPLSFVDSQDALTWNITTSFLNLTQVQNANSVIPSADPIWNGGLEILLNNSTRHYAYNHTLPATLQSVLGGAPTVFNGVPLGLNSTRYPILALTFTTTDSAIRLEVATTPNLQNLSAQSLQSNFQSVAGAADNLGIGDPQLVPSYGAGYFTSSGTPTTLTIDLPTLLSNDLNKTVDYLFLSVLPVAPNGTGLRGVPLLDWPGNQTVQVTSFGATNLLFRNQLPPAVGNGTIYALWNSEKLGGVPPPGGSVVADSSCLGGSGAISNYSTLSPTSYQIELSNIPPQTDCAIVELVQNYASQWTLTDLQGVTSWSHVVVDGYANGFVLNYAPGTTTVQVTIEYSGQAIFIDGLVVALAAYVAVLVAVAILGVIHRRGPKSPPAGNPP